MSVIIIIIIIIIIQTVQWIAALYGNRKAMRWPTHYERHSQMHAASRSRPTLADCSLTQTMNSQCRIYTHKLPLYCLISSSVSSLAQHLARFSTQTQPTFSDWSARSCDYSQCASTRDVYNNVNSAAKNVRLDYSEWYSWPKTTA